MIIRFETENKDEIDELPHYLAEVSYLLGKRFTGLKLVDTVSDYEANDFLKIGLKFKSKMYPADYDEFIFSTDDNIDECLPSI